jgi:CheY-like chemotaxis protein
VVTGKKTVLVVDDTPTNRYVLCRWLHKAQYMTLEAATGAQALEQARRCRPDAIVLDMNLPDQSGATTLQQLRSEEETASIPVVMLSATAQSAFDCNQAEALGASAYLFSPVPADTLVSVVKGIIERAMPTKPDMSI